MNAVEPKIPCAAMFTQCSVWLYFSQNEILDFFSRSFNHELAGKERVSKTKALKFFLKRLSCLHKAGIHGRVSRAVWQ